MGGSCVRKGSAASFCACVNFAGIVIGICFDDVEKVLLGVIVETFCKKVLVLSIDEYEQGSVVSEEDDLIDEVYMINLILRI